MTEDYIGIEGKVLDAVAAGAKISFAVALRVGIRWSQADAIIHQLVKKGLLRKVKKQDVLGTWYEYEECDYG